MQCFNVKVTISNVDDILGVKLNSIDLTKPGSMELDWTNYLTMHFFLRLNANFDLTDNLKLADAFFENLIVSNWKLWTRIQYGSPISLFENIVSRCNSLKDMSKFEITISCRNSNCESRIRSREVDQLVLYRQQLEVCNSFQDFVDGYMLNGSNCTCGERLYTKLNVLPSKALLVSVDPSIDPELLLTFQSTILIHGSSWSLIARVNAATPAGDHFTTQISDKNGVVWDHDPMYSFGQMLNQKDQMDSTGKLTYFLCYWRN
jgi:hypothetical protein